MEDFRSNSRTSSPASRHSTSTTASRSHTPSRLTVVVEPLSLAPASPPKFTAATTLASPSSASTTPRTSLSSSGGGGSPGGSSLTSSATVTELESPTQADDEHEANGGSVASKETSFIREKRKGAVETV